MELGKNLVLISAMGWIAMYNPGVAKGENTAAETQTATEAAPAPPAPAPATPAPAPEKGKGPMGWFNITPEIGYAFLGGQGVATSSPKGAEGVNIDALKLRLDLKFGGAGSAFDMGLYFLLMHPRIDGAEKPYGGGLYLGFLYSWYIPTAKAGAFYPGVGFDWEFGGGLGGGLDAAAFSALRVPISCTWYPSKTSSIGIVLEWGLGIQLIGLLGHHYEQKTDNGNPVVDNNGNPVMEKKMDVLVQYGFYTDLMIGVRFL